ncbi:ketoacyl-ACP synthase III family protein [Streptomyces spinoverrucosus]|uniref:ketoacyl-ACP synthase III family protein n=1 Tax=Streptomyces spinoverrucosus TaxID=284043 RepID=UPI0018C39406|nr:ketoacyl-ACP synthase III family protein [Streptomyces spinoverrucosus]MBG0851929.1 ketoacyl-ACP synthase III family protein [Streptomyces spinoverrucosus]
MRFDDLYIAGAAAHLEGRSTVAEALRDGRCDERTATRTGIVSVAVSTGASAPELAVGAARQVLERTGTHPTDIDLLLHATVQHQGHDLWAPASYIQRYAVGNRCPAIEIKQLSNGGMAALELASGYLAGASGRTAALLTTGDVFCEPGFDRWRSDPGTVYGDAGTALVLGRSRTGFARLRSLVTVSDADLEQMHRGRDPFSRVPFEMRQPIDLGLLQRTFIEDTGRSYSVARITAGQDETLKRTLAEADCTLSDVSWFVLPNFGRGRLNSTFLRRWNIPEERTTWPWGRSVGHLGAGDQFAGLAFLAESGRTRAGELGLLYGVGAGFSWSCAVVEFTGAAPEAESAGAPSYG